MSLCKAKEAQVWSRGHLGCLRRAERTAAGWMTLSQVKAVTGAAFSFAELPGPFKVPLKFCS